MFPGNSCSLVTKYTSENVREHMYQPKPGRQIVLQWYIVKHTYFVADLVYSIHEICR